MVAYSFRQRFAQPILDGTKVHTIRADRKRHAYEGEELQLYTGMRTRQCKLVARVTCRVFQPVQLDFIDDEVMLFACTYGKAKELDTFARNDGFADWYDLRRFWAVEHPDIDRFPGFLIGWRYIDLLTLQPVMPR